MTKLTLLSGATLALVAALAQPSMAQPPMEKYNKSCGVCHNTGAAGAPKTGDVEAWAPRMEKGMDTLMGHVVNGFNAMPPKGTCMSCSEADLKATVEYMIGQSQ